MPNDNEATVEAFLASKGLSRTAVAGIMGGLQAESGFDPTVPNHAGSGAYGLAQWLGGRLSGLHTFAQRIGGSPDNLSVQLQYLWAELTGTQGVPMQPGLAQVEAAATPQDAAYAFVSNFERPGARYDHEGDAYAEAIYNGVAGRVAGAGGTTTSGGSSVGAGGPFTGNAGTTTVTQVPTWFGDLFFPQYGPANQVVAQQGAQGLAGIGQAVLSLASGINDAVNFISLAFKPSFWLRVGAFVGGFILFILGINEFRHAI